MEQRLSLVTLGVTDLDRATAFYQAMGWQPAASPEGVVFFQAGGMVLALWDRAALAVDSGTEALDKGGWGGVTLAQNVRSAADVDELLAAAQEAGAQVVREPSDTFWGGYAGCFLDPDGHAWEIAYNPYWAVTDDGRTLVGDGRG